MKVGFALLLGIEFLITACTTQIPTPSQAQIVFMAAQTVASNQSVSYDQPSRQTSTQTQNSPTATLVPPGASTTIPKTFVINIATQIAKPKPELKAYRIYGVSILDTGSLLVEVEFSPLSKKSYSAKVAQDRLQCNTLPENPARVYCHGPVSGFGLIHLFRLYEEGQVDPVFVSDLWVPGIPPTPDANPEVNLTTPSSTPTLLHTPVP